MRVASIHLYPVKSCHRVDVASATVEACGLAGDRRLMLVDEQGRAVTQRTVPALALAHPRLVPAVAPASPVPSPGLAVAAARSGPAPVPDLRLAAPTRPDLGTLVVPLRDGGLVEVTVSRDTLKATPVGPAADGWFSRLLDRPVHLVWLDDPARRAVNPRYARPGDTVALADTMPVLLANTASLAALNDLIARDGAGLIAQDGAGLDEPVPLTRFRPNLVVAGAPAWAEDAWVGRRLRIGAVVFRVPKGCDRCVLTTTDQETGVRTAQPLRALARHRTVDQKMYFGVHLIPDGTGVVSTGDPVTLLD